MPVTVIAPTTNAVTSRSFKVIANRLPLGVSAFGLADAEEVVIHKDPGDGVFRALTDTSATMTATEPDTVIEATGTYKLVKTATAGDAGASIG